MKNVSTKDQVIKNLLEFDSYKSRDDTDVRSFYWNLLKRGKKFVVAITNDGKYIFAPSRFVGYADFTWEKHVNNRDELDGKKTTPAINRIFGNSVHNDIIEKEYLALCKIGEVTPTNISNGRTHWLVGKVNKEAHNKSNIIYPDEVPEFIEGATTRIIVNAYERDPKARRKCLEHYGYNCSVCGMKFEDMYGEIGIDFIHVHHIKPISMSSTSYSVDPIEDLRPVCPNCHSMLHRKDPPISIDELRDLVRNDDEWLP